MILDLFNYFSQFPDRDGVKRIFSSGSSSLGQYSQLQEIVAALPPARLPDIKHIVFGPSMDSLKKYVDGIEGTFLIVDYGEIKSSTNKRNSFVDSQELALTVAMKRASTDLIEEAIISNTTLLLLSQLRRLMYADSQICASPLFERESFSQSNFIPFSASQLSAVGWTMMLNTVASDILQNKGF